VVIGRVLGGNIMRCLRPAAVAVLCGLLVALIASPAAIATVQVGELLLQPGKGQPGDTYLVTAPDAQCEGVYQLEFGKSDLARLPKPGAEISWTRTVPADAEPGRHAVNLYCEVDEPGGVRARAESTLLATGTFEVLSPLVEPVEVPDLKGLEVMEAQAALADVRLNLGKVSGGEGEVIRQSPSAGTSVPPDSLVDVVLEEGVTLVTVPNLIGQTVTQARALLKPLGLTLVGGTRKGRVATQDPDPGTEVTRNTSVRITLRAVTPSSPTPSPSTPSSSVLPTATTGGTTLPDPPVRTGRALLLGASGSLVGLLLLAGAVLLSRTAINVRERRWIRKHVHAEPRPGESDPPELRTDPRLPSTAIRLEPHQDAGTHGMEEEP
jgi:hypothetical protein